MYQANHPVMIQEESSAKGLRGARDAPHQTILQQQSSYTCCLNFVFVLFE